MIRKEENQENPEEEVTFKVSDRRKFNADGSVKDGVVFDEPQKRSAAEISIEPEPFAAGAAFDSPPEATDVIEEPETFDLQNESEEFPGADDPASFVNFLSTLATNAAASLGAMPHPSTGQRSLDLDSGKYWIDVLSMIAEKTKGNLQPQEARLMEGILGDLRMQYVTMVRATEEQLKQQAAKKFTDADILGKR